MKIIKFLLAFMLLVVLGLVAGSFFLPSTSEVVRSVTINQTPEKVFTVVNNITRFNEWSPWHDLDPDTKYELTGPAQGVGARLAWNSEDKNVGSGSQEIIESVTNEKVVIALDFGQQGTAISEIHTQPQADMTELTWKLISNAEGSIIGKYFNLMLDSMVGPMYEKGLAKLKDICEQQE